MTNILIWAPDNNVVLRRTLYNLSIRRPSTPFQVFLATKQRSDLDTVKMFSSMMRWTVLVIGEGEKEIRQYVPEPAIWQDGRAIPTTGFYDSLICLGSNYQCVVATTLGLPADLLSAIDSFGSNITKPILDEAENHPVYTDFFKSSSRPGAWLGVLNSTDTVWTNEACLLQEGESEIVWQANLKVCEVISNS